MEVRTAGKLGYCSGVSQAIEQAIDYGDKYRPVYSLGTVAHNEDVVEILRQHGVEPIKLDELKKAMNVVITAHGAPPELYKQVYAMNEETMAGERIQWSKHTGLLDCTCPIVKKAQSVVKKLAAEDFDIVIFGDPNHQEVKGLVGWSMGKCKFVGHQNQLFTPEQEHKSLNLGLKVGVVSQTTKDPSDYRDFVATLLDHHLVKSSDVRIHNTICPIVTERIDETRKLAAEVDMMLVVGSVESANTRNLEKACRQAITRVKGCVGIGAVSLLQTAAQVDDALDKFLFDEGGLPQSVGVTAGTSTPIEVVEKVVNRLKEF